MTVLRIVQERYVVPLNCKCSYQWNYAGKEHVLGYMPFLQNQVVSKKTCLADWIKFGDYGVNVKSSIPTSISSM
jgi:hypothetical protein